MSDHLNNFLFREKLDNFSLILFQVAIDQIIVPIYFPPLECATFHFRVDFYNMNMHSINDLSTG